MAYALQRWSPNLTKEKTMKTEKNARKSKLKLNRETIRIIDNVDLVRVIGGASTPPSSGPGDCPWEQ